MSVEGSAAARRGCCGEAAPLRHGLAQHRMWSEIPTSLRGAGWISEGYDPRGGEGATSVPCRVVCGLGLPAVDVLPPLPQYRAGR